MSNQNVVVETVAGSIIARSDTAASQCMLQTLIETMGNVVGARHTAIQSHLGAGEMGPATPVGGPIDGGLVLAFDNTIINVLRRMDALVNIDKDWRPRTGRCRQFTESDVAVRLQKIADGATIAGASLRPSARFSKSLSLAVSPDGNAQVHLRVPGGVLIGEGKTFGEAIEDFDAAFNSRGPVTMPADYGNSAG